MTLSMRRRELLGALAGMAVAAIAVSIAVVISGNYEDLGDRSLPFIYAPGAGVLGFIVALAIADGKPVPDAIAAVLGGLRRLATKLYTE